MIHENVTIICGKDCHRFTEDFQPDDKILWEPEREIVRYTSRNVDDIVKKNKQYMVFVTHVKQFHMGGRA